MDYDEEREMDRVGSDGVVRTAKIGNVVLSIDRNRDIAMRITAPRPPPRPTVEDIIEDLEELSHWAMMSRGDKADSGNKVNGDILLSRLMVLIEKYRATVEVKEE